MQCFARCIFRRPESSDSLVKETDFNFISSVRYALLAKTSTPTFTIGPVCTHILYISEAYSRKATMGLHPTVDLDRPRFF